MIDDVASMLDRERVGREASPPEASSTANRSVREAETSGYDAGKRIVGRKRHIAVDTDGRLLMVNLDACSTSPTAPGLR